MEARLISAALVVASTLSLGANYRTQNFIITAHTPQFAKQLGDSAEAYRRDLAIEWLGRELPPWQGPCPITAHVGPHLGAGGATSFMFDHNRPFGWTMTIQGSEQRILDSVLPHEITHTIFATHFGRPLPRWADEGACTTVEHVSEKNKQKQMLISFLTTGRGIAFNRMFAMREYPADIMPLYSQGYALARFLIAQKGKREFIDYVGDGMDWNNWTAATKKHYGYESLSELQVSWLDWVRRGSPSIAPKTDMIAARDESPNTTSSNGLAVQTVSHDPSATSGTPVTRLAGARPATFDSWYARQRTTSSENEVPSSSQPGNDRGDAGQSDATSTTRTAVTRALPPATPEVRVLQSTADQEPNYDISDSAAPPPMVAIPAFAPRP